MFKFEPFGQTKAVVVEKNYLGRFQLATPISAIRRLDFGECSVEVGTRWWF